VANPNGENVKPRRAVLPQREVLRLNWGCGLKGIPGWINSDLEPGPGVDHAGDIRNGLPFPDGSLDYIVGIHALQCLRSREIVPALRELRRVLKPGGVLRLGLPDLDRAIQAYNRKDFDYFIIDDDEARTLSGKFVLQMTWYGKSRSMFTQEFISELLHEAGFREITPCAFRQTRSPFPDIVTLDNREKESLFVEASA
jgi:predicted SAM-dependent methyltransferase